MGTDQQKLIPDFIQPKQEEGRLWIINGRKWFFDKECKPYEQWSSGYVCKDGDIAELYIEEEGFTLHCFSGVQASRIQIDRIDFSSIMSFDEYDKPSHELQCLLVADRLCRLFCEYKDTGAYEKRIIENIKKITNGSK